MHPPPTQPTYSEASGSSTVDTADGSEARLVARMADRDEQALADFHDRWCARVEAVVLRMVRDADDAADVVEEVFWQCWRQASRFDAARGNVERWVLTIARSRALDRLRARRRSREDVVGDDDMPVEGVATDADPASDAEHADRRTRVASALATLPPEQRVTLELAYFGGYSQSEIAARTGQPLGTIKTRMRLALQKLRSLLAPLAEDSP